MLDFKSVVSDMNDDGVIFITTGKKGEVFRECSFVLTPEDQEKLDQKLLTLYKKNVEKTLGEYLDVEDCITIIYRPSGKELYMGKFEEAFNLENITKDN